jgi:hypothetical protein
MDIVNQLVDLLMQWLALAFCWLIDKVLEIVFFTVKSVLLILPNIAVPSWMQFSFGGAPSPLLQFVAWLFPVGILFWAAGIWLVYEVAMAAVLPIYRMIMDLF